MPGPVFAISALGVKERIPTVRGGRKRPAYLQVGSESHYEDTFSFLRNAVIGGVNQRRSDGIGQFGR